MKISDVEFFLVQSREGHPVRSKPSLLVRLAASPNREGWGEANVGWRDDEPAARRNAILPVLVGRNVFDIEDLLALDELRDSALRSAVEMASWDLIARSVGQPLCHLFGGGFRRRVPLSIRVPQGSSARVAELSRELAQQGFHAQVISASGDPAQDVRTLDNIRQNVGEHIQLRLDGQGRYDLQTARDLCRVGIHAVGVFLRSAVDHGIAGVGHAGASGERAVGGMPPVAERGRSVSAGPTGFDSNGDCRPAVRRRVDGFAQCAAVAQAAHVSMSLDCASSSGLGLAAMVQLAAATPVLRTAHGCDYHQLNHDLLLDRPEVVDGMIAVPQGPGLGVEPDRARIERLQAG